MHVKHENEMKASKYVSKFSRQKLVLVLLESWVRSIVFIRAASKLS